MSEQIMVLPLTGSGKPEPFHMPTECTIPVWTLVDNQSLVSDRVCLLFSHPASLLES